MKRIILHIDFDSFFASVEQQDNPRLRNRPIGVTATNGRTAIIAASREAKRLGIKSPSRTHDAIKICPSMIFVPAHFVRYWEISKKFLRICNNFSPVVEVFSLDEVFMDVSLSAQLFGGVSPLIEKLKTRLQDELGEYITASVGISHNKLLAKLASGMKKPNGVMEITPENVIQTYNSCKLTDFCGIGERIKTRLNQMGIYTPLQLRLAPLSALIAEFGNIEGKFLKDLGMGIDKRPVIHYTQAEPVKSVGRNYCLPQNEYDKRVILQNVYELCEEVTLKLRRLNQKARTVGIYLRGPENVFGRHTVGYYFDTGKEMFETCLYLLRPNLEARNMNHTPPSTGEAKKQNPMILDSCFLLPTYTRQISVWASNLVDAIQIPSSLFLYDRKYQKVIKTIDALNEKFGDHTIRNGFLLYADKLTTVPNGFMADRYERAKLVTFT